MRIMRHVDYPDHLRDRTVIGIRDGAGQQQENDCPLRAPTHPSARPAKRGPSVHDQQRRGVNAAPGMRCWQGDRLRIVLFSVTVEDVTQQEHEGGQWHKRHRWSRVVRVQAVIPISAYHICISCNGLPGALAGLFAAHRVYETMSQGTVHLRPEDLLESYEP